MFYTPATWVFAYNIFVYLVDIFPFMAYNVKEYEVNLKGQKMSCYIIAYDLNHADTTDYKELFSAIKRYPKWAHISESVWAVVPQQGVGAAAIRDNLKRFMDKDDRLFVVKSGIESAWHNSMCTNEWLKENL